MDTTRDKFGARTIERMTFKYLVKYTPPADSGYLGSEPFGFLSRGTFLGGEKLSMVLNADADI
jgi:hypothetical protein